MFNRDKDRDRIPASLVETYQNRNADRNIPGISMWENSQNDMEKEKKKEFEVAVRKVIAEREEEQRIEKIIAERFVEKKPVIICLLPPKPSQKTSEASLPKIDWKKITLEAKLTKDTKEKEGAASEENNEQPQANPKKEPKEPVSEKNTNECQSSNARADAEKDNEKRQVEPKEVPDEETVSEKKNEESQENQENDPVDKKDTSIESNKTESSDVSVAKNTNAFHQASKEDELKADASKENDSQKDGCCIS